MSAPELEFDRVYTMTDYHDGPRCGIADFQGRPHTYNRPSDDETGELLRFYELRPIDAETLQLALEQWEMWLRYHAAWHAHAETTFATHPALPEDRERYSVVSSLLAARLAELRGPTTRAHAIFRPHDGYLRGSQVAGVEVQWTPLTDEPNVSPNAW